MQLQNNRGIDHWLTVRKAWVAHLITLQPIAGLVPTAKIWGENPPAEIAWPFIRIGMEITTPFLATGWSGSSHRLTTHAFDKSGDTNNISRIAAAIVEAGHTFSIATLDLVDWQWVNTNVIRDTDEKSAWHAIIDFDLIAVQAS